MKVIYPITLDVKKTNIQKKISAFTEEGGVRELVITLVSGNDTIEVTNDYAVSVVGVKPDGTEFANTATVRDGKIHYTLTTQNVAVPGDVDCQIRVFKTNELLYTSKFLLIVENNLSDEESETSSNEWTELITALNRVNSLSVVFTGEGAPTTDPQDYPDIQESNFYYDETNARFYYATNVSTTVTWERIYNKTEIDAALDLKADKSTTYTKTEVDTALSAKANSSDVYAKTETYTKSEVDTAFTNKTNKVYSAVFNQDGTLNTQTSNYPGIKANDLITGDNDDNRIWGVDYVAGTLIRVKLKKNVFKISGTPTTTGAIKEYNVDDIVISDTKIYYCSDIDVTEGTPPTYTYTWTEIYNAEDYYKKSEVDTALATKQNSLTAGSGIDITSNTISFKRQNISDNLLKETYTGNYMYVGKQDVGYDEDVRSYLQDSTYDNPLAPKAIVSNEAPPVRETDSVKLDYGQVWIWKEDTDYNSVYVLWNKTNSGSTIYSTYHWLPLPNAAETQEKLTAGTNITIDSNNVISATGGGGSYTAGNGIDISNDEISVELYNSQDNGLMFNSDGTLALFKSVLGMDSTFRNYLTGTSTNNPLQPKLTAGTNITIDANNVISASGGSYTFTDGLTESSGTVGIDLKSGTELQITNGELDIDLSDYYTKIETYNLAYDSTYRLSLTDTNYSNPLQTKITSNNMLSSSLINDSGSMTKLFVTATDKSTWNSKSKVFPAVYDNGALDVKTATYSHIKENDLIVCNGNNIDGAFDGAYLKRVVAVDIGPNADEIALTDIKETYSIQGTPPTTAEYGVDFIYQVGNILLSENGNIYYCASATYNYNTETFTYTWRTYNIADKQDKTDITTDTTSTTVSLTLADNHEYRYTQDLTSLTLTMPSGDFISSIVFASGSTPTSMTYDSSIKWSGDDISNGQFVPTEKTYNIVMWYDGININGVVRGV